MKSTQRGNALLGAGAGLLLAAILSFNPTAAVLGLAAISFYALQRLMFERHVHGMRLAARRRFLAPVQHEDVPLLLETRVDGLPSSLRARLPQSLPSDLQPMDEPAHIEGQSSVVRLRALRHGRHALESVRVEVRDAGGLFTHEVVLSAPAETLVLVSARRMEEARVAARRRPAEETRTDPLGPLLRELDVFGVREYQAGDPLRDIDWKSSSRFDELMTKTTERDAETNVLLLLDASRTMRQVRSDGSSRLEHGVQWCVALAEIGVRRNQRVSLLVIDEARVLDEMRVVSTPSAVRSLAKRLASLPPPLRVAERLDVGAFGDSRSPDEFLRRLAMLHPRTHLGERSFTRISQNLSRTHSAASLLVIAFTDLESDPRAFANAVAALRSARHSVVCGVYPEEPAAGPASPESLVREAEQAYAARAARETATLRMRQAGARVVEMDPRATAADLALLMAGRPPPPRRRPRST